MSRKKIIRASLATLIALLCITPVKADEPPSDRMLTAAILSFSERGEGVKDLGIQVSDLLFAKIIETSPELILVERQELKKILDELHLSATGMVSSDTASKLGKLTGAQILITGSVFKIGNKNYFVAKIIGVETGRVSGTSVNGKSTLDDTCAKLAAKIATIISQKSTKLLPKKMTRKDLVAVLKKKVNGKKLPSVYIDIPEKNYSQPTIDPAAQTEIMMILKDVGFKVVNSPAAADIQISGEAFSESVPATGKFFCAKGRVEIKALSGENVIVADRQTSVSADLVSRIAGKNSLQKAGRKLAERIISKLAR